VLRPVQPHEVPAGPLAVRWHGYELPEFRAGATAYFVVDLENAGSAPWRSQPGVGVHLGYHWLDLRGNPIVWAGAFVSLPEPVAPDTRFRMGVNARAPIPPGRYRLALDLVDEGRAWFSDLGNHRIEEDVDVLQRLGRRTLAVAVGEGPPELVTATRAALAMQAEPIAADGEATAHLAAGCRPDPDWSRRVLDAHAEGYAAVGGSIDVSSGLLRHAPKELEPWRPGFGRSPNWTHPLLCPSLLIQAELSSVAGLPALHPSALEEPWLCDGRIRVAVAAKALRLVGRRSA
jgi:hypothetical protein